MIALLVTLVLSGALAEEEIDTSGYRTIALIDEEGQMHLGVRKSREEKIEWGKVGEGIIDAEITSRGILWAVNEKQIYRMVPFTDPKPIRESIVPIYNYDENFRAITVGKDNTLWTTSTENMIQTNKSGHWGLINTAAVSAGKCGMANDISIAEDGAVWIICDEITGRMSERGFWDMQFLDGGSHIAAIGRDDIVFTDQRERMIRHNFAQRMIPWTRRRSNDLAYYEGAIWKLAANRTRLVEYTDEGADSSAIWGEDLPFVAGRLSVGPYITPPVPFEPDLGENKNLAKDDTNVDKKLKDDDTGTCIRIRELTVAFTESCPGGRCRVNYILLYPDDVQLPTQVVLMDGDVELTIETGDTTNITIPDNKLGSGITIKWDSEVDVCEVVIAGTDIGDYKCSAGFNMAAEQCVPCTDGKVARQPGDTCEACPINTVSAEDNTECISCDFLEYSEEGSTVCRKCRKDSTNLRCYNYHGYDNVVKSLDGTVLNALSPVLSYKADSFESATIDDPTVVELTSDSMVLSSFVVVMDKKTNEVEYSKITTSATQCSEGPALDNNNDQDSYREIVFRCSGVMSSIGTFTITTDNAFVLKKLFVFAATFDDVTVDPGFYNDGTKIDKCSTGSFSKGGKVSECTQCLENQFQDKEQQPKCENCEEGYFSGLGAVKCTKCSVDDDKDICNSGKKKCQKEIEKNAVYGSEDYVWPDSFPGETVKKPCEYNPSMFATKECKQKGKKQPIYSRTNFSKCNTRVTEEIDIISEKSIDEDNQIQISEEIKDLAVENSQIMNTDNVEKTANIIDKLAAQDVLKELTKLNILKTVDKINSETRAYELAQGQAASKIKNSVLKLAEKILDKTGSDVGYMKEETVSVAVKTAAPDGYTNLVISSPNATNIGQSILGEKYGDEVMLKVEIPFTPGKEQVTAILYNTDKFFPSNGTSNDIQSELVKAFSNKEAAGKVVKTVASIVTEVSYVGTKGSVNLTQDLKLQFRVKDKSISTHYKQGYTTDVQCSFFTDNNEWSTEGCTTERVKVNGIWEVNCKCNHMTSFAVLMSFSSDYDQMEDIVSQILLAISLGCLLSTIIAYLPAKDLLKTRTVRLNLLLATSLVFAIITFYFMEVVVTNSISENNVPTNKDTPSFACLIVAFMMNYFWLCQIAWMVTEAVVMYRALVSCVVNSHIHRYMLKFNIVCWGIPLIFPIAGISWGKTDYANPRTCFLQLPYGYVTFYGPVAAAILFNSFIFVRIGWSIFQNKSMGTRVQQSEIERRKKQFKFAVTVMSLLGISWIFGFFLIIKQLNQPWLRWIFIIFNSSQGISIFVLYVVFNDNLRKVWLQMIGVVEPDKPSHSSVPYNRSKGGKTKDTTIRSDYPLTPIESSAASKNIYSHIYDNAFADNDQPRRTVVPYRNRVIPTENI